MKQNCATPSLCLSSPIGWDYRHVIRSLACAVLDDVEANSGLELKIFLSQSPKFGNDRKKIYLSKLCIIKFSLKREWDTLLLPPWTLSL